MTEVWRVVGWLGLFVVIAGMALAAWIKMTGKGTPWTAVAVMAPGVLMYQVGVRMLIRTTKKEVARDRQGEQTKERENDHG